MSARAKSPAAPRAGAEGAERREARTPRDAMGCCRSDASAGWIHVCGYDELVPERGVAALVGGEQVALFRTFDGMLYAIGNRDPFSGAFVLCRGIVGSHQDAPTVASPLFKQAFDLRTGRCLTEPDVSVPVHEVRRAGDRVEIRVRGT